MFCFLVFVDFDFYRAESGYADFEFEITSVALNIGIPTNLEPERASALVLLCKDMFVTSNK